MDKLIKKGGESFFSKRLTMVVEDFNKLHYRTTINIDLDFKGLRN